VLRLAHRVDKIVLTNIDPHPPSLAALCLGLPPVLQTFGQGAVLSAGGLI
jgi:hypothetical protein